MGRNFKKKSIWNIMGKNPTLIGTLIWALCMPFFMCSNQIKTKERWMIFRMFIYVGIVSFLFWKYVI